MMSLSGLGLKREWEEGEVKTVRGIGGIATEGKPLTLTIITSTGKVELDVRTPPQGILDEGCEVLLSAQHCRQLGIDVNHALSHLPHLPVRYLRRPELQSSFQSV